MRVLLIDAHRLFADVIQTVLEGAGMEVVMVSTTAYQGIQAAEHLRPEIVLIDLALPDASGIEAGAAILKAVPGVKVLALTAVNDPRTVAEALRLGFHGYLTKDTPLTHFVGLINAAIAGQVVLPHRLAAGAAGARSQEERNAALLADQLTAREKEVLAQLVAGRSSVEMSRHFSVSPNTIRTHVQSIFAKLQVHSRLEAATFAVRYGIVEAPRARHLA